MDLPHIHSVGFTCSCAETLATWYNRWLGFEPIERREHDRDAYCALVGLPDARLQRLTLALGEERLELTEILESGPGARAGRPLPADSRSNELWFQHICLVLSDLQAVAPAIEAQVRCGALQPISTAGPQRLPDLNAAAAGIVAYEFHDPDGHPLELLQFPAGKGDARWHQPAAAPLLGIDHSAIGVSDPQRTARFYGELLGLSSGSGGTNRGAEQDHLDGLENTEVQITPWRAPCGMGIEALAYRTPAGRLRGPGPGPLADPPGGARSRAHCGRPVSEGIVALQGCLAEGWSRALQVADPDRHRLQLVSRLESARVPPHCPCVGEPRSADGGGGKAA